jgi:hypothetical protein
MNNQLRRAILNLNFESILQISDEERCSPSFIARRRRALSGTNFFPAFYLYNFTPDDDKDVLYILDQDLGMTSMTMPFEVEEERDLGRHKERFCDYGDTGKQCCSVINNHLSINNMLPDEVFCPSDESMLLPHVFRLFAEASLDIWQLVDDICNHSVKEEIKALSASDAGWNQLVSLHSEADRDFATKNAAGLRKNILDGRFLAISNAGQWGDDHCEVDSLLAKFEWSLKRSSGNICFICSDNPIGVHASIKDGLVDVDALVEGQLLLTMPLSKNVVLCGHFNKSCCVSCDEEVDLNEHASGKENEEKENEQVNGLEAELIDDELVLRINSRTILDSMQIFSETEKFQYLNGDGQPADQLELIRDIESGNFSHDNLRAFLDACPVGM